MTNTHILPTLAIIPGWSVPHAIYKPLINKLSPYYSIKQLEWPHMNQDSTDINCYSLNNCLDDLQAKLSDNSIILGWSLGGMLAMALAKHYPHKVSKLITLSSNLKFVQSSNWPVGMEKIQFETFKQSLHDNPTQCLKNFRLLMLSGSKNLRTKLAYLTQIYLDNDGEHTVLIASLDLLSSIDLRSEWPLKTQGLHIYGKHDALVPITVANYLQKNSVNQRISVLDHASHIPFLDDLDGCVNEIFSFLSIGSVE